MAVGTKRDILKYPGKTATTEFAAITVGSTVVNPHSPPGTVRTPGGSSSGSGASVGDCQVPMALATQTGGSTIRPASFNGIYALKPTWGVVSREGQKFYSLLLDTLGWYGRSVADLSLMADIFNIRDDEPSNFQDVRGARFAVCRTDNWPLAGEGTKAALAKATELLRAHGATVDELILPPSFAPLPEWHRTLLHTDGLATFLPEHRVAKSQLHESLVVYVDMPEFSRKQQLQAQDGIAALRPEFDRIVAGYDAMLTPSVVDEAPEGLESTGDAVFCAMWTVCLIIPLFLLSVGLFAFPSWTAGINRDLLVHSCCLDASRSCREYPRLPGRHWNAHWCVPRSAPLQRQAPAPGGTVCRRHLRGGRRMEEESSLRHKKEKKETWGWPRTHIYMLVIPISFCFTYFSLGASVSRWFPIPDPPNAREM